MENTESTLVIGDALEIKVCAKEKFSAHPAIFVNKGECYAFKTLPNQRWKDWFIKTTPKGFFNFLLLFSGRRVKKVKCFALCGTIQKNEEHHFYIGNTNVEHTVPISGDLYFFANDYIKAYGNNKGAISVNVKRLK